MEWLRGVPKASSLRGFLFESQSHEKLVNGVNGVPINARLLLGHEELGEGATFPFNIAQSDNFNYFERDFDLSILLSWSLPYAKKGKLHID